MILTNLFLASIFVTARCCIAAEIHVTNNYYYDMCAATSDLNVNCDVFSSISLHIAKTLTPRTVLGCAAECGSMKTCLLYGYNTHSRRCLLMEEFYNCTELQENGLLCYKVFVKVNPTLC